MGTKTKSRVRKRFRLCYVDGNFAYFTTRKLSEQWGDDWNDAPYEHNAGPPYLPHKELSRLNRETGQFERSSEYNEDGTPGWEILKLAYDGPLDTPASWSGMNSPYSVESINQGAAPWLMDRYGSSKTMIPAGVSPSRFRKLVEQAGGTVYFPRRKRC